MDITSDTTHSVLYRICKEGAPEYVMKSPALNKEAASGLPQSLFADPFNRRYPIDSKASTWMSAAYLAKSAGEYADDVREYVLGNIRRAADAYGNRNDVDDVYGRLSPKPVVEKRAEDDMSNYGWPEGRKYPMFDEEGVKRASSYFQDNAYGYPPDMRHTIAKRIFAKCAEYGIEPSRAVRTESGNGVSRADYVMAASIDRARRASDPRLGAGILKMSEAFARIDGRHMREASVKFASFLEQFDMATGLHKSYGVRVESPAEIFFGRSVKEASDEINDTVVLNGNAFSIEKLAELPVEVFTGALGEDFGERVKSASGGIDRGKLSDELYSLPVPDKKALYRSIVDYAG